jgi:Icc-related predicted phosphoesterase
MRIAATADLHFTPQNYDRIREPLSRVRDEADVLIIAGDLTNYGKPEAFTVERTGAATNSDCGGAGQS